MALFEPFPNYIRNLSVAIAMESGAQLGEIIDMCQPLKNAAATGADAGTPQFMAAWAAMGARLIELAAEDEAKGRSFSASNKLERASSAWCSGEPRPAVVAAGRRAENCDRQSRTRGRHAGRTGGRWMTMRDNQRQSVRRLDDLRCSAMAITTLTIFVGSFWLAGILF